MKRGLFRVFLVFILVFSIFTITSTSVLAQDETNTDSDSALTDTQAEETDSSTEETDEITRKEIAVMHFTHGARMRILHLHRSLARKIWRANTAIDYLKENGEDVTDLEDIVAELELLRDEVKEIPESDSQEEAVRKFIDIKQDTKSLIKEFREIAHDLTTVEDRNAIHDKFESDKQACKDALKEIDEELKHYRRLVLVWEAKRLLEHFDIDDEEILTKIENGEITLKELKERLRTHYRDLPDDKKRLARDKVRDAANENNQAKKKAIKHFKKDKNKRDLARIRDRAGKLENAGHPKAAAHLRKASDNLKRGDKTLYNARKKARDAQASVDPTLKNAEDSEGSQYNE